MDSTILMGLARHLLTIAGGVLVSKGFLNAEYLDQIVGAVISLAGVVMSAVDKVQVKNARATPTTAAPAPNARPATSPFPQQGA